MLGMRSRATLYLVLIFLCGLLSGAVGTRWLERGSVSADSSALGMPQHGRAGAVASFTRKLDLNPQQQQQLTQILEETRSVYREHELEIESIRQDGNARIRSILNDTQKAKFDQLVAERAKREREKEKTKHERH